MEFLTAFLIGLAGSVHCAGMCGPLALAVPIGGNSSASFAAERLAYNLGRIFTYSLLGLLFGLAGQSLAMAGFQRWLSLGLGSALLLSLLASRRWGWSKPATVLVGRLKAALGFLLCRRSLLSVAAVGLLNGLLPCGLVYVAGAGAAATGHGLSGAAYMASFGAGTLPMMAAIGFSRKLVPISIRWKLQKAIPVSIFLVGTLLILRGLSLGIPYLSPDLVHGSACCPPQ
jgi:sulfite exporter TauE/SafE